MATNTKRAAWARLALSTYTKARGSEDPQTDAKDLINDLMHYLRIEFDLTVKEVEEVVTSTFSNFEVEAVEDVD